MYAPDGKRRSPESSEGFLTMWVRGWTKPLLTGTTVAVVSEKMAE